MYRPADQGRVQACGDIGQYRPCILNVYPRKGRLGIGSDADIVVWDPGLSKTISVKSQISRIDYNVFEGFDCSGAPAATLSGGRIAFEKGELRAEKGAGKYLERAGVLADSRRQFDLETGDRAESGVTRRCDAVAASTSNYPGVALALTSAGQT